MAILKKTSFDERLETINVLVKDTEPNSRYFKITELSDTFSGGKNSFLIQGSPELVTDTVVKIQIKDSQGNIIYNEPGEGIPEYYEGTSKVVSVYVYPDTSFGPCTITILGELNEYISNGFRTPIPDNWKDTYNVKWEKQINVNPFLANTSKIRFYRRPKITISESVLPIYNRVVNRVSVSGSINGTPLSPNQFEDYRTFKGITRYELSLNGLSQFSESMEREIIEIKGLEKSYTPIITDVTSNKKAFVDIPYYVTASTSQNYYSVTPFTSASFTMSYDENVTLTNSSINTSFAKINITDLETFSGDVNRIKVYASSKNDLGDFQLLEDIQLESNELLITSSFANELNVRTGLFTSDIIETFWTSSAIVSNVNISTDNSILLKSVVLTPQTDASSSVGLFKFYNSKLIEFTKNTEYQLDYTPLLVSAAQTFGGIDVYMSGSAFVTDSLTNRYGKQIGKLASNSQFKKYDKQQINFKPDNDGNGVLVFIIKGGTWHIADVSLRAAQESSFSPNEITLTANVPVKINNETFDFKFELYDINNTFVPVLLEKSFTFTGGNDVTVRRELQLNVSNNSFNFSTGSSFPSQITIDFTKLGLTGSVSFASQSVDITGNPINGTPQPGTLQYVDIDTKTLSLADFTGSSGLGATVGAISYTASCEDINRYFTIFRIDQGAPARLFYATADKNTFVFDPDDRYKSAIDNDYIDIRLVRQNLPAFENEGYNITSGSEVGIPPPLYEVESVGNATVYRLFATSSAHPYSVTPIQGSGYTYNIGQSHYDFKYDTVDGDFTSSVTIDAVLKGDKGKGLIATSDANQFFYKMTNLSPAPTSQTISILVKRQNLGSISNPITVTKSGSGPNLTYIGTSNGIATYQIVAGTSTNYQYNSGTTTYTFTAYDLNGIAYSDEITISTVIAESQISVNLTNENATLPARSTGFVPTTSFILTSGSVSVKVGGEDITREEGLATPNRFDIISATGTNCTPNDTTPDDATYGITALTADSGSLDLVITYKDGRGVTTDVSKSVTYSKAKSAAPSVSISTTNKAQSVSAKSTGGQIDPFADTVVTVTQAYNNSISNLTLTSLTATSSDLASIVTNNSTGVITLAGRTLVDGTNATSITVTAVVTDSEGQSRTLTDTISLTKVKKAAPVLTFIVGNNNQSTDAKSTGEQITALANSTLSVREQYNGVNTTLQLISAPTINSSSAFTPITKSVSNLIYPTMPTATDTIELGLTGSVADSEGVTRTLFGNVSLTKVKKAVPNVEIAVSPTAQTIVSNSKGSGSAVPQTLTISALEGNVSRFLSLGTPVYTNGLSGTTSTNTLTFTANASSMSADTGKVTIPVNYTDSEGTNGTKNVVATISKARTATPTTVVRLSSDTQTILSSSAGYAQPQPITVTVSEGATDYTYSNTSDADMPNSTYKIIYSEPGSINYDNNTVTPATPTTNNGITLVLYVKYKNSEGTVGQIDKTHNVVVTTGGATGQDGSNGVNIIITPVSQTVTRTISGVYSNPIPIVVSVIEGGINTPYTYSDGLASNKTFKITAINQTNTAGSPTNSNGTITLGTPNDIAGSVVTFNVTYKDSKGTTISDIAQTHNISVVLDGQTGPGVVFTGVWEVSRAYQFSTGAGTGRRDVVLWSSTGNTPYDTYYGAIRQHTSAAGNVANGAPHQPSQTGWESLGTQDLFVAAKIGLFEESYVQNTLNIGTNTNGGISSANITLAGGTANPYISIGQSNSLASQGYSINGIFLGRDNSTAKFSIKSDTNSLTWDGSSLTINGGGTFSGTLLAANGVFEGTVTAESGEIGGWSIGTTTLASTENAIILDSAGKSITISNIDGENAIYINGNSGFSNFSTDTAPFVDEEYLAVAVQLPLAKDTYYSEEVESGIITTVANTTYSIRITETSADGTPILTTSTTQPFLSVVFEWYLQNQADEADKVFLYYGGRSLTNTAAINVFQENRAQELSIKNTATTWNLWKRIKWGGSPQTVSTLAFPKVELLITRVNSFTEIIAGGIQLGYSPTRYVKMYKSGKPSSIDTMLEVGGNVLIEGDLDVNGVLTYNSISDKYLKENLIQIPNALYKVNKLNGVEFDWKAGYSDIHSLTGHDVGVIAQEVEEVLPEIVKTRDNGYKSVQYEKIVVLLIEAVKELSKKVNELELNISGSI